jgi:hypothetical protein
MEVPVLSKKVRPLAHKLIDEMQMIVGSMDVGDYASSLKAIARAKLLCDQIEAEIRLRIKNT